MIEIPISAFAILTIMTSGFLGSITGTIILRIIIEIKKLKEIKNNKRLESEQK